MAILANNARLINIGKDYSAGSGIDITNDVISVIGNTVPYSAGENIDIQDFVISGKDWSNDITDASSNAFNETTAWVHDNYTNSADVSFLSAEVDKKLDSSVWEAISGSLATEDYVILSDNLTYARATAFATSQGYAKESACNSAFDYLNTNKLDASSFVPSAYYPSNNPSGFITGVDLGNYYTKNETSGAEELANAFSQIGPGGDEEVNSFVYDNSATINDVNTSYQTNSGNFLTAAPADMATTGDVADLAHSVSETYQVKGDYLTTADSDNFYPSNNPSGFITGVDLSNYYQKNETSGADELAEAFNNIPHGDEEVNDVVHTYSADGTWLVANDITGLQEKGDYYSASNPSGFLVPNDISNLASISLVEETSGAIVNLIPDTSNFITNASAEYTYQTIEGMTAYQPTGDYATESFVQNVSADITALIPDTSNFITNSSAESTYQTIEGMTAYQPTGAYITINDLHFIEV